MTCHCEEEREEQPIDELLLIMATDDGPLYYHPNDKERLLEVRSEIDRIAARDGWHA